MNVHKNAPVTPKGREAMVRSVVEGGLSQADAAFQFNTTPKTVAKWVKRFREDGVEGLRDRSSRPYSSPSQTPPAACTAVEALRRQRHTGKQIAAEVAVSPATISRILRRLGLNRIRALEPAEPERRYERQTPGEIIHIDIKKLGRFERVSHRITGDPSGPNKSRGAGWDFVHVCIDDHSRVALLGDQTGRDGGQRRSLPQGGCGLLQKPRGHCHSRHDRQRELLPVFRLPRRAPGPGHQAYPH